MKKLWKLIRTTLWIVVILAVVGVGIRVVQGGPDREAGMAMQRQAAAIEQHVQTMEPQAMEMAMERQAMELEMAMERQAQAIERQVQANVHNWQPPAFAEEFRNNARQMQAQHEAKFYQQHSESNHHGFGGGIFMTLAMLIAGAVLLAKGGRKAKIVGGILLAIVLLPWLFALLSLLVPVALIFLVWRYLRRKDKQVFAYATPERDYSVTHTVDYLDEWEQKTMRNNKEEK